MSKYRIENVAMENLTEHSQVICFLNPKHKTYPIKIEWLRKRFEDGLVIKMIHHEDEKKSVGHKKHRNIGVGKMLIDECRKDAKNQGLKGVAVLASGDSFMVDKDLFLKNGFELVATEKPKFSLLVDRFEDAPLPYFNDWKKSLSSIKGLNLIYSDQCPWVSRFVVELTDVIEEYGLTIKTVRLETPQEAQAAPSPYGVFCLVNDGKLLADHYISLTRFKNILRKEKLI